MQMWTFSSWRESTFWKIIIIQMEFINERKKGEEVYCFVFSFFLLATLCRICDLSFPTRNQTHPRCITRLILRHWTPQEVPGCATLKSKATNDDETTRGPLKLLLSSISFPFHSGLTGQSRVHSWVWIQGRKKEAHLTRREASNECNQLQAHFYENSMECSDPTGK